MSVTGFYTEDEPENDPFVDVRLSDIEEAAPESLIIDISDEEITRPF